MQVFRWLLALLFLLSLIGLGLPANAYLKAGPVGYGHWLQGTIAPLDGADAFATPAAAYSMRRLKSSYSGPAIRLRRASDNLEADINFLSFTGFTGAPIDTAQANAHCAATSCFLTTWYDQSGNARHATQATPANQLAYIADCGGGLPCAQQSTTTQRIDSASAALAAKVTLSVVGNRSTGTAQCYFIGKSGAYFKGFANPNYWYLTDFVGEIFPPAVDGAWHAGVAVVDGASSLVRIDGTETTGGTINSNATPDTIFMLVGEAAGVTCRAREGIVWSNYVLTVAERAALTANQKSFWGF